MSSFIGCMARAMVCSQEGCCRKRPSTFSEKRGLLPFSLILQFSVFSLWTCDYQFINFSSHIELVCCSLYTDVMCFASEIEGEGGAKR